VIVLLFPGQGAQKVGMAADLAAAFPAAREALTEIDDALGFPLSRMMAEGPEAELQLTHNTQPAILAHSVAVMRVVAEKLGSVAAAAGHSLGEYSAYVAAGSLTGPTAARLVRRRGELMYEAGQARQGAMSAVLGLGTAEVEAACAGVSSGVEGVAVAANLNAPDQTVISGDPAAVARAGDLCKAAGAKRVLPLKVSGAFHSPLMAPAVSGLTSALAEVAFEEPSFPVIANASASLVSTAGEAIRQLADQLTAPVRWVECMQTAAEFVPDATFLELGPGSVLTGLLRRILPEARCLSLGTAAEVERFLA
jgi:[acyl-carrier-protein] S-malonyltransferase